MDDKRENFCFCESKGECFRKTQREIALKNVTFD